MCMWGGGVRRWLYGKVYGCNWLVKGGKVIWVPLIGDSHLATVLADCRLTLRAHPSSLHFLIMSLF